MSLNQFEQPPEIKPEGKKLDELEKKAKENRFVERLSVLKIDPQEMKEEDMEKLKSINERIEQADAAWVVRVMDEIKRKGGEEYLLKSFGPEDVETLGRMGQKRGLALSKEGIVGSQARELASALIESKKWHETLGSRAKERIKAAEEELKKESPARAEVAEGKTEKPEKEPTPEVKEAQVAEVKREKTHEEVSRQLLEHPTEALRIFKKGIGLKLDRACIGFTNFWEKTGARALKVFSWTGEKAVGYPAGELKRAVWTAEEFFEAQPGIKRLDNVLKIHTQIERLQNGELTPEQAEQLKKLQELHKHAARGQWQEIEAFNKWHERKNETLKAFRTFGRTREKLSGWVVKRKEEAEQKKEQAAKRRVKEIAEKF